LGGLVGSVRWERCSCLRDDGGCGASDVAQKPETLVAVAAAIAAWAKEVARLPISKHSWRKVLIAAAARAAEACRHLAMMGSSRDTCNCGNQSILNSADLRERSRLGFDQLVRLP
jgi:hypothetical protein